MSTFTKPKSAREVWSVETFAGQGGATICDLRLKRKNGLGEFVPVKSNGTLIALIANVDHFPALIAFLGEIYQAVKGDAI